MQYSRLQPALQLLKEGGFFCALETNGTFDLPEWQFNDKLQVYTSPIGETLNIAESPSGFDHITVSPKSIESWKLRKNIDAVKLVYWGQDLSEYESIIREELWSGHAKARPFLFIPRVFLQPCWDPSDGTKNRENILRTIEYAKKNPMWRVSIQWHKMIGIP
jgi:organic radical activating enzyme